MKKAEITAFLSMTFVLLVSFVLGILEISVIHTSGNLNRLAVDRAVFSMFGEYHVRLFSDYQVFAVEGTYGTGEFSEEKVIGRMQYYGAAGIEQDITGIQYLTDQNGQAFREQVLQYMEEKYGLSAVRGFTGLTSEWEEQALQGEEMEEKEKGILDQVNDLMETAEHSGEQQEESESDTAQSDYETGDTDNGADANLTDGGPFTCIEKIEKSGILSVVMPGDMELSGLQINPDVQVSNRELNRGRGIFPVRQGTDGIEEKLMFNEYVLNTFTNAAGVDGEQDENVDGRSGENGRSLAYETEYIIEGRASDKENLEAVLTKIFLIRMAMNYAYLMGDQAKQAEAGTLATAVTAVLLIPEASEILKQLILLAWAAGEGVVDIRTLLAGNRAALIKTSENWQLPLSSLLTLGSNSEQFEGADTSDGISYREYMRILLFLEDPDNVTMRVLDRVEENLSTQYAMSYFRSDQCITKIQTENTAEILGDITYSFPIYFGYK